MASISVLIVVKCHEEQAALKEVFSSSNPSLQWRSGDHDSVIAELATGVVISVLHGEELAAVCATFAPNVLIVMATCMGNPNNDINPGDVIFADKTFSYVDESVSTYVIDDSLTSFCDKFKRRPYNFGLIPASVHFAVGAQESDFQYRRLNAALSLVVQHPSSIRTVRDSAKAIGWDNQATWIAELATMKTMGFVSQDDCMLTATPELAKFWQVASQCPVISRCHRGTVGTLQLGTQIDWNQLTHTTGQRNLYAIDDLSYDVFHVVHVRNFDKLPSERCSVLFVGGCCVDPGNFSDPMTTFAAYAAAVRVVELIPELGIFYK